MVTLKLFTKQELYKKDLLKPKEYKSHTKSKNTSNLSEITHSWKAMLLQCTQDLKKNQTKSNPYSHIDLILMEN